MSEKMTKLVFRPSRSHRNHNDEWNHFTAEDQVGEYPEDVAKQKLADFPLNFKEYRAPGPPEKKAYAHPKPVVEEVVEEELKKVADEPDKALKLGKTKTKA